MKKEAIVIGLGISGCAAARLLADAGYAVSCFERQSYIGGNLCEEKRANGQLIQTYGPHIFHTDREDIYSFLKRFGNFYPYAHRVLADCSGVEVPVPLNFTSLSLLFKPDRAEKLKKKLTARFGKDQRVALSSLLSSGDTDLIELGKFIDANIQTPGINRVSEDDFRACDDSYMFDTFVETGDSDVYYRDKYQATPILGFTALLESMLNHPNISYYINEDAFSRLSLIEETGSFLFDGIPFRGPIVYTPSVDILFNFCYGHLPFRTSKITYEDVKQDYYLKSAVTTRVGKDGFLRISESKYFTLIDTPGMTSICKESAYISTTSGIGEPFEPDINSDSLKMHHLYVQEAKKYSSLYLLGRLACYKNLSIAECISQAMELLPL
ncbi:MAG: NAD(P)-binding protein [Clostridiales bacterium]|nr:NAD(P)-binding protein [Clostridiales bacterium]